MEETKFKAGWGGRGGIGNYNSNKGSFIYHFHHLGLIITLMGLRESEERDCEVP
jgi:hypothetical protein